MDKDITITAAHQTKLGICYTITLSLSIIPLCYILCLMWTYKINIPFWDDVDATVPMIQRLFSNQWQVTDLFAPHNLHRTVIPRLLYIMDYYFYAGNTFCLVVISFLAQLGQLFLLSSQLKKVIEKKTIAYAVLLLIFSSLLFAPQAGQIWFWPFVVQQTLTPFFFMLALTTTQKTNNNILNFSLLILYSFAAIFSSANGLVVWPICFIALIQHGHSLYRVMLYGLIGLVSLVFYCYPMQTLSSYAPLTDRLHYFLSFLGAPFGMANIKISFIIGAAACLLYSIFLLKIALAQYLKNHKDTRLYFWLGLGLFTLGSALMGALGKAHEGVTYSMSDRYMPLMVPFWCAVFVLGAYYVQYYKLHSKPYFKMLMVIGILFLLYTYIQTAKKMPISGNNIQLQLNTQELALSNNHYIVNPNCEFTQLNRNQEIALRSLQFLKVNQLALFHQPLIKKVGKLITAFQLVRSDKKIEGHVNKTPFDKSGINPREFSSFDKGLFISGSISKGGQYKGNIYILNESGQILGLGLINSLSYKISSSRPWFGFVSADAIQKLIQMTPNAKLIIYYKEKNSHVLKPLSEGILYL